jgi:hypothetical protein
MPSTYLINKEKRLIVVTHTGTVSNGVIEKMIEAIRSDPDFDASLNLLSLYEPPVDIQMTVNKMKDFAGVPMFAPTAKRAVVISSRDPGYSTICAFYAARSQKGEEMVAVFDGKREALAWLGVAP